MQREKILIVALFFLTVSFFFYPIFKGYVPFPGDLLVGGYQPYKSYSYLGYAPGGVPNKGQGPDVVRIMLPWKYFAIEQLRKGELPLWNPHNFSGNTHLANLQSAPFYFLNVFFVLPFFTGWTLYIFSIPFLAGIFTYFFLREIKLSKLASILGGVSFAFSAFMVVWLQFGDFGHTFLWLPLILLLIHRYVHKPKLLYLIFITISLTCALFAGYIQLAIYLYFFVLAFCLYHFLQKSEKQKYCKYLLLLFSLLSPFFIASLQILPLVEIFLKSARSPYGYEQLSERLIPPINLITILFPDFFGNPATRNYWLTGTYIERAGYIGVIPLVFAVFAWFARKMKYTVFFFGAAFLSYLSALDLLPVKLFHAIGIPILSTGVPSRVLVAFCFSMAILAAIGFDHWLKDTNKKRYLKLFGLLIGIAIITWVYVLLQRADVFLVTKRNLILPTGFLSVTGVLLLSSWKHLPKQLIAIAFIAVAVVDLFFFFHKITPFSPPEFVYPKTTVMEKLRSIQGIDRSWGYGEASIDTELQIMERIYSTDGYGPLFIKRYAELVSVSKNGKKPSVIDRTNVNIKPGYGADDLRTNQYRQKMLNLLGVRYVLHRYSVEDKSLRPDIQTFPADIYQLIWQQDGWQIYENMSALPRVFLTTEYVVKEDKDILETLISKDTNVRDTIVLESKPSFVSKPRVEKSASVVVSSYKPNSVVLRTKSRDDSLLFLSDNYFPGWKASVDEKDAKIYRADYAFRAVEVPKGTHEVAFRYNPESFRYGLLISGIAVVVFVLFGIASRFRKINV